MNIGYIRISQGDQSIILQEDALAKHGCAKIFQDIASGSIDNRQGLAEAISFAREGDVIVVWRLDRLGRSLKYLIETINYLDEKKIGFKSITENIDTQTPGGKLIFHIFGALAEFERELIRARTKAGLEAARVRGRKGGRPRILSDNLVTMFNALTANGKSIKEISNELGVSKATLYRCKKS